MRRWGKKLATVLCILLLCLMSVGCGKGKDDGNQPTNTPPEGPVQEERADVVIETEFGSLHYPEQWSEFIKTRQDKQDERIKVEFLAQLSDKEYPLFNAVIGDGDGVKVGEVTDAAGQQRPVYIEMTELEKDPDLAENEQNRLYAMQEDLNYLIDHLK